MVFLTSRLATEPSGDLVDRALAICWILAEAAVDVFGTLFWAGLALAASRAVAG